MGDSRTTFPVDNVVPSSRPLERVTVRAAVSERVKVQCDATFDVTRPLVTSDDFHGNKFYAAVHTAYQWHYPLVPVHTAYQWQHYPLVPCTGIPVALPARPHVRHHKDVHRAGVRETRLRTMFLSRVTRDETGA